MDNAVALVRAYLHVNGYFTVTEFPVLEAAGAGGYRQVTDLDVLAFRFAEAGSGPMDSELECPADRPDMLIGEVKEGRAQLNRGAQRGAVIAAALTRFGCCPADQADAVVRGLLRAGRARTPAGHTLRLVVFAAFLDDAPHAFKVVSLGHVVRFLEEHLRSQWSVLRHATLKDPAFGFLMTLEKARRQAESVTPHARAEDGGEIPRERLP